MEKLIESYAFKNDLEIEGFVVKHPTFGIGTIVDSVGGGDDMRIHIKFEKGKPRWLIALPANLSIISNVASVQDFVETLSQDEESIPVSDVSEDYETNHIEEEKNYPDTVGGAIKEEVDRIINFGQKMYVITVISVIGFGPMVFFFFFAGTPDCYPPGSMC